MWALRFGLTIGGLLIALLLIAIAIGTSVLIFAVLIAAAALAGLAILFAARRAGPEPAPGATGRRRPRSGAAPAAGEGSTPPSRV